MAKRKRIGLIPRDAIDHKPGLAAFCSECGDQEKWDLYELPHRDDQHRRFKAVAVEKVCCKANYALNHTGTRFGTNGDESKLKRDRPDLHTGINTLLCTGKVDPEAVAEAPQDDPFGERAESRGHPLTGLQQWNRALLHMRELELHWRCRPDAEAMAKTAGRTDDPVKNWEHGIRQAWFGCFRGALDDALQAQKDGIQRRAIELGGEGKDFSTAVRETVDALTATMPDETLREAVAYITAAEHTPDYDLLMKAMRTFHRHKGAAERFAGHEQMLNWLAGTGRAPWTEDFDEVLPEAGNGAGVDFSELL